MTRLQHGRQLKRELAITVSRSGRPLVVTIANEAVYLREKGTRTTYTVPWPTAWYRGADLAAQQRMRDRAAKRKAQKAARR